MVRFTVNPGILPDDGIQFPDSVRRAVRGMDQGLDRALGLPSFQSVRDLAEAGYDLTGLGGHGEGFDHGTRQQSFGISGERRRHTDVALESLAELVTPDGFRNRLMGGRNPKAAAGELAFQIRDHLAGRS